MRANPGGDGHWRYLGAWLGETDTWGWTWDGPLGHLVAETTRCEAVTVSISVAGDVAEVSARYSDGVVLTRTRTHLAAITPPA